MLREFKLPDVGEGLTEAEIVKWHVAPGDTVTVNQTIVEIETAKAVVELPCPFEGKVAELLVAEGQTVEVGTPIISVRTGDAPAAPEPAAPAEQNGQAVKAEQDGTAEKREPVLVGYGVKPGATRRRRRSTAAATAPTPAAPTPAAPAPSRPGRSGVLAKPPVRKLAKDLGIDLSTLTGTGPHGSITRADVEAAAARLRTGQAAPAGAGHPEREERIPVRGVRKATAQAMVASAFTAPHVTEFLQVDVTETMAAVERLRRLPEFAEVRVSPLLLVAKALITAVKRHPMINSTWTDEEIIVKHYVNLGIAAATERGLIVPNIKDADRLSLPELARELNRLVERARAGRCTPAELTGGTITITNVGVFGVDAGTPILNPGEVAILALGQIRDMPWVVDGQLAVRKVTTLALSFDHRVVDGELGSKVLRDVGAMLEDPIRMLAWG
ncbi:dihydrolipoamide acetyltransferase family protein [Thermobispora bispora]|uniref:Dihydrolipoamide acetyltransferase component of pyruvate dehydrogenase complex n=1 Tax=Thermobispora bispora (strain ATCC 19993 / DSM 43833 / CBS 139.67 / JCM 10125 / KCTC 9307 / NBRC 14880 / R51) TaxID=469371 RepID=D6Y958_THEBD|nr:dihydrolipoamide acetyltransferase family protein [Thermobispora bispora]ADG90020.1 catalytic domain of components of various dehydrogenase complexes [Thermobispora bispora DSM 43833]